MFKLFIKLSFVVFFLLSSSSFCVLPEELYEEAEGLRRIKPISPENQKQVFDKHLEAGRKNHAVSQFWVALFYAKGIEGHLERNSEVAAQWMNKAFSEGGSCLDQKMIHKTVPFYDLLTAAGVRLNPHYERTIQQWAQWTAEFREQLLESGLEDLMRVEIKKRMQKLEKRIDLLKSKLLA